MEKGLLFVVSAPAGCGKDTILEQLFKVTENVGYSVSATSRAPREGEVDGVHYHFRTREQFDRPIGSFQAVGQRLADGYIDVKGLRLTLTQAAWKVSEDIAAEIDVASAAFWAAQAPDSPPWSVIAMAS